MKCQDNVNTGGAMRFLLMAFVLLSIAACSSQPQMQRGPDAEIMAGGLYKVDNTRVDSAFIKPDLDFSYYKSLLITSLDFADRLEPVNNRSRSSTDRPGASWEPGEKERALLRDAWHDVTQSELGEKSSYTLAQEKGSGVMVIDAKLIEVELTAPLDDSKSRPVSARSKTYSETSGSMTMQLTFSDSLSGEKLAFFIDKRSAPKMWRVNNSVSNYSDARTVLNGWANQLRRHLEEVYTP